MRSLPILLLCAACPPDPQRAAGIHPAIQAGSLANDVALASCGERIVALVPASGDGNLDVLTLPDGDLISSVFLDDANPPGPPAPFAVAADGADAFVTLREQNAIARVTPCDGAVRSVTTTDDVITIDPPLALRAPQDADGDGDEEIDISAMRPRGPQPVIARDGRAIAAFTNVLQFGLQDQPPRVGPGFVLASDDASSTLDCTNPQGLAFFGAAIVASCTGPLGPDETGSQTAVADGALVFLDDTLTMTSVIDAGRFAPGTPASVGERIVVGSVVTPRVACLDASFDDASFIDLDGPAVDSVFAVVAWDDTRALAVQFSNDTIHVVDAATCTITQSIALTVGAARGALAIDVQKDQRPIDAAVVLGLSSEIVPLSLFEVIE